LECGKDGFCTLPPPFVRGGLLSGRRHVKGDGGKLEQGSIQRGLELGGVGKILPRFTVR